MLRYSPGGYVAAVKIRTSPTLLVEGDTDKSVVARLIFELRSRQLFNRKDLKIDTANIFDSPPGRKLGNREKVEFIHSQIGGSGQFAALVDREFRDFGLAPPVDHAPYHRIVPHNLFWTRGHSIENYFSDLDIIMATLEHHFPEHLPGNCAQLLAATLPGIIRACATISLSAQGIFQLHKIREVKSLDHWQVDAAGNVIVDLNQLLTILAERNVDAQDRGTFESYWRYYAPLLASADLRLSQWICHGHLADSHLWSGVAVLLNHFGTPDAVTTQIAWGAKEAEFRTATSQWCRACAEGAGEFPEALLLWLRG